MSLNVTQADADKTTSAHTDFKAVVDGDALVGGVTLAVRGVFGAIGKRSPANIVNLAAAIAMGVIRGLRVHPVALAVYTLGVANPPAAALHPGSLVYVSNGAVGLPIVAFSDGTNWLRVDTRTPVST